MNTTRSTRPLTTDELVDRFARALSSLARNCEHFSGQVDAAIAAANAAAPTIQRPTYDFGPINAIATELRVLLSGGQGNQLLARVCAAASVDVPRVALERDAAFPKERWNKITVEHCATGAIPVDSGGTTTSIIDVWDRTCVALIDQNEPTPVLMTWGELIRDIADKDSAHVDVHRPTAWDFIDQYHIGVVPTMPFLLYRLAIAIVDVGSDMLRSIGRPEVITTATESLAGFTCHVVWVTRSTPRPDAKRPGRNDRCPCGSGFKFKRCCGVSRDGPDFP